jgi:hypothetical protein
MFQVRFLGQGESLVPLYTRESVSLSRFLGQQQRQSIWKGNVCKALALGKECHYSE